MSVAVVLSEILGVFTRPPHNPAVSHDNTSSHSTAINQQYENSNYVQHKPFFVYFKNLPVKPTLKMPSNSGSKRHWLARKFKGKVSPIGGLPEPAQSSSSGNVSPVRPGL